MSQISFTLRVLLCSLFLPLFYQSSFGQACGCTFTISGTTNSFDGAAKGVKPGDKICFANGTHPGIWFNNINGTAAKPVLITNSCDGTATINAPLTLGVALATTNSTYFRVSGSGNPAVAQGLEVIGAVHGVNLYGFSNHFEIDHLNVHDQQSCGIVAKTDVTCTPTTWRSSGFLLQGISFHDNAVTHTGAEGFYIGCSHYDGGVATTCGGVATVLYEHNVTDVQVYNNVINYSGNEGIQVGSSKNAVAHHNIVNFPGSNQTDPSQANAFAANAGTQMTAYDNFLNGGKGFGIVDIGGGGTYYNNIIMNALSGGMEFQDIAPNFAPVGFTAFNNTVINCSKNGVWMYSENPQPSYYYNNIVVGPAAETSYGFIAFNNKPKNIWNESNNVRTLDITTLKFVNAATNDFHLLPGSSALDQGKDVSSYGINFDYDGNSRPKGTAWDIGAFEYQPNGPHSNAGPDQIITLPTSTVSLPGSGTSATGITGYTWTKKSGGVATLSNATTATLSVSGLAAGVYVFELQVTDVSGSDFDDVQVTVQPLAANVNPTANAGPDKILTLPTNSVTLSGMGTDTDGSIASYSWSQTSGPAATLAGNTTANLALSNLVQGSYAFLLTVTDNLGATGTDAVNVTVNAATVNQLPVTNAGTAKTVFLPATSVNITATASDPDGTIATIAWVKKSGGTVTLGATNALTLAVSGLSVGVYVFTITVTDNSGGQASSDVMVTVLNANQSPTATAGPDRTVTLPANSITLNGLGFDNDGSIAGYLWTQVSGPACTLGDIHAASLPITNLVQGTYVFGLTVTDNQGATGYDEATVSVSVAPPPPNQSPLAFAGGNQSFSLPTNSTNLYGSGFDPDGAIVAYHWVLASGGAATLTNADQATLSVSGLAAGQYKFTLTVTDNGGATNTDAAFITVSGLGTNISPVADAGANKLVKLPQSTVNLDGIGSDADGTIAGYAWTEIAGAAVTIGSPSSASTQVTGLVEGDYVFQLMVTDNLGATDLDNVTVHVVSTTANLPPVVNAGPDLIVSLPTNTVTINATATDDGTIANYAWVKLGGPAATLVNPAVPDLVLQNLVEGIYTFQLTVTDDGGASVFDVVRVSVLPGSFQAPVVSAGSDQQITLPTNQISISGTATSASSSIATLLWTEVSGPAANLGGTGTLTLTATNMVAGTYIFKLTATDNNALSTSATVQVVVNPVPPNQAPIVNAGAPVAIQLPVSQVILAGTASDPDGTVATVKWTQTLGPNTASLQNQGTLTLTASSLDAGTYTFRLTATDNLGAAGFSEVLVSVAPPIPVVPGPIALAGNDTTIVAPDDSVSIVGHATDATASIQTYLWEKVDGPSCLACKVEIQNETTLKATGLELGTYTFRLTVTDDNESSAVDEVNVYVIENGQDIPKFFSPNGDAIAQYWVFKSLDDYKTCKLSVFSRSGQVVYEAKPYDNTWDGTWKGRPLVEGDYYYNLKCDTGNSKKGAVRIIR